MGCNTSKDTPPQNDKDDKTQQDNQTEATKNNKNKAKSNSAKTVTLVNGTVVSKEEPAAAPTEKQELQQAATKIQAAFRGHQSRKSMKQPGKHEEPQPTQQELEAEFRADDTELCHAATRIQASFRGHMIRKQMEKPEDGENSQDNKKTSPEGGEELDIDLTDPELNKAAVKIQASFRGHMTRKEEENSK